MGKWEKPNFPVSGQELFLQRMLHWAQRSKVGYPGQRWSSQERLGVITPLTVGA